MPDTSGPSTVEQRGSSLQEALPVVDACLQGVPAPGDPRLFAHVWVDPSLQPRLAVLASGRLLRATDGFDYTWAFEQEDEPGARFLLDARSGAPVQVAFRLLFPLPQMIAVLDGIVQFGLVSILPGPPPARVVQPGKQGRHSALFEAIEEQGSQAVVLALPAPAMSDLGEHLERWKARFPHLLPVGQRKGGADGLPSSRTGGP